MLTKIISGGQTGADQGGLEAGRELGLATGGTAPYNYMTECGPQMAALQTYGLVAGKYDPRTYPKRTEQNVKDADATVIFGNVNEVGSNLTFKLCIKHKKTVALIEMHALESAVNGTISGFGYETSFFDVSGYRHSWDLRNGHEIESLERKFVCWLHENDVHVLDVAGNRESKASGIQKLVKEFLVKTLKVSEVLK
jgi:hypothetical protein